MPLVLVAPFEGCKGWTQLLVLDFESSVELGVEGTGAPGLEEVEVEEEEEWMDFEFEGAAEFAGFMERLEIEGNDGTGRLRCGGLQ